MPPTTLPTVLITGCSNGGIGSALATAFHQHNYHVFATARNVDKMSALQDLPNVTLLSLDVTQPAQIDEAVEAVRKAGGGLDVLVNNAGQNYFMPILDVDIEEAKQLYETNVWGPLRIVKRFMPLLIEKKGIAAFISSVAGHGNIPYLGTYGASKRSLEIMAETLRLELHPFNVTVLSIVTGAVKSQGQTYFTNYTLPSDSLYKPIESTIAKRAQGEDGITRMETMRYANDVVGQIIKRREGLYWSGSMSGFIKWASKFMPRWLSDLGSKMGNGLDQLTDIRKAE